MLTYCLPPDTSLLKISGIKCNGLVIDYKSKQVFREGKEIRLTAKEYSLLVLLAGSPGRVFSKSEILSRAFNCDFDPGTNSVEVFISFTRAKVDREHSKKLILSRPGFGYYLSQD